MTVHQVLGIALERDFTGVALVDTDGTLVPLPSIPRSAFTVRDSTSSRRTHRREALADLIDSLDQTPILAVVSTGRTSSALALDAEGVLEAAGVPVAVTARHRVVQFGTGSPHAASYQLLSTMQRWPEPRWTGYGEPSSGCGVQAVAAAMGVAALGGTQPIPSSPGRDRAIASVQWPSPLPTISEPR